MPRRGSRNRNRMTYYEYRLGYNPRTNEEAEEMNREIELMDEEIELMRQLDAIDQNKAAIELEQATALRRMTLPYEGLTLKEEIMRKGVSPEAVEKELAKRGLTVNSATGNQLNSVLKNLYEGGPIVEGVGTGRIPTRRENKGPDGVRGYYPRIIMPKHLATTRHLRRGAMFEIDPTKMEGYNLEQELNRVRSQMRGLNQRGGRKKTCRRTRKNRRRN